MFADVLRNLGIVLAGTALGLSVALGVELARRFRLEPAGTPWQATGALAGVIAYGVGLHIKAAAVNVSRFGNTDVDAQLVAFLALGILGNVALLGALQVAGARRLLAEQSAARTRALEVSDPVLVEEEPVGREVRG